MARRRGVVDAETGKQNVRERSSVAAEGAACPVCASTSIRIWFDGHDERLTASALGPSRTGTSHGRILRCAACGLGFRQMRPSQEELSQLYRDLPGEGYEAEAMGRCRTALRHLKIVQRYRVGGQLLDVGCASGAFLRMAADAGWAVVGVEPSKALCDQAKAALDGRGEVIRGSLEEAVLPLSSFEVVTLWDVLEHVPDPVGFIRVCGSLLKSGGYMFANVPNVDSFQARALGARWPLLLPEHLCYFNRRSLLLCGERAGLTWLGCGRRSASFSLEYALHRLTQHHIPGASRAARLARLLHLDHAAISMRLGELYGVWTH